MIEMDPSYYLYFAAFLLSSGVYVVLSKRNVVFILFGVELILNAGNLVLATFSQYDPGMKGQVFAIFAVVLTVCEVAIALAILLNVFRKSEVSDLDQLTNIGNE
ncbi:MAG: NADH-quinone oxidoreductase subunit NuoK [Ekhidna sp.]